MARFHCYRLTDRDPCATLRVIMCPLFNDADLATTSSILRSYARFDVESDVLQSEAAASVHNVCVSF